MLARIPFPKPLPTLTLAYAIAGLFASLPSVHAQQAPIIVSAPQPVERGFSRPVASTGGFSYQAGNAPVVVPNYATVPIAAGVPIAQPQPFLTVPQSAYITRYPGYGFGLSGGYGFGSGYGYGYPGLTFGFSQSGAIYPGMPMGYYRAPRVLIQNGYYRR